MSSKSFLVLHPSIGSVIVDGDPTAKRDSVHIAVLPVIADELLLPGQFVTYDKDNNSISEAVGNDQSVGIVDPFLRTPVTRGQKCWLFIHPGAIKSLRHEWEHPLIDNLPPEPVNPEDEARKEAEAILQGVCARWNISYRDVLESAKEDGGRWFGFTAQDTDVHSWEESGEDREKVIAAVELLIGKKFPQEVRDDIYFSCSC